MPQHRARLLIRHPAFSISPNNSPAFEKNTRRQNPALELLPAVVLPLELISTTSTADPSPPLPLTQRWDNFPTRRHVDARESRGVQAPVALDNREQQPDPSDICQR